MATQPPLLFPGHGSLAWNPAFTKENLKAKPLNELLQIANGAFSLYEQAATYYKSDLLNQLVSEQKVDYQEKVQGDKAKQKEALIAIIFSPSQLLHNAKIAFFEKYGFAQALALRASKVPLFPDNIERADATSLPVDGSNLALGSPLKALEQTSKDSGTSPTQDDLVPAKNAPTTQDKTEEDPRLPAADLGASEEEGDPTSRAVTSNTSTSSTGITEAHRNTLSGPQMKAALLGLSFILVGLYLAYTQPNLVTSALAKVGLIESPNQHSSGLYEFFFG